MKTNRKKNLEGLATGEIHFCGDLGKTTEYLYVYPVVSSEAEGEILSIDFSEASLTPGFVCGYTANDIPGRNVIGAVSRAEEPLLAENEVHYRGQPVGFVIADTQEHARLAARRTSVHIRRNEHPVLTIQEAISQKRYYHEPLVVATGDLNAGYAESVHVLEGVFDTGAQEHAYIETQRAFATYTPFKRKILIHADTQAITDVQEVVALILGRAEQEVEVDVYRVGGAFGGKERGGTMWAAIAALALEKTDHPCAIILDRSDDILWTGKRHPYHCHYKVGCDVQGRLLALEAEMYADGGYYEDFTEAIMERSVLSLPGSYYIPACRITGFSCQTNKPANTAFRGFGAPQATLLMEEIIYHVAKAVKLDVSEVQKINFLKEGQLSPYGMPMVDVAVPQIHEKLLEHVNYNYLRKTVDEYNAKHKTYKKGIGIVPVKYGIGFTATFLNQGNALVYIYTDGSISVSHGGIEMGQGLFTKIEGIVAKTLGVNPDRVVCESTNSLRAGSVASTAASTGTDLNGEAARAAAQRIRESLQKAGAAMLEADYGLAAVPSYITFENDYWWDNRMPQHKFPFNKLVSYCYYNRYMLGAQEHYATPGLSYDPKKGKGTPFAYFTNGVALAVVGIDMLTGDTHVEYVSIRHEGGSIIDYDIERGQLVGGFMQGLGYAILEELPRDKDERLLSSSLSTYKVPLITDVPDTLDIELFPSQHEICGVLGAKGLGEPPLLYGVAVFNAVRDAVDAARGGREVFLHHPAIPCEVLVQCFGCLR
ncbi:MAG: molybdopterin cofactor-binding domain-containing protein [Sphaerochaeta sp.]